MYEKALSIDPNFVASYVGIGNNQMFMDRPGRGPRDVREAREDRADHGERRQAKFWTAATTCTRAPPTRRSRS